MLVSAYILAHDLLCPFLRLRGAAGVRTAYCHVNYSEGLSKAVVPC